MNSFSVGREQYKSKSFFFSKSKYIILSLKSLIMPCIFCLFTICLVIFSSSNLSAAKNGLLLWANNVVPALFPFFIAIELLNHTNIIFIFKKILTPIMKPLFNVSGSRSLPTYHGNN